MKNMIKKDETSKMSFFEAILKEEDGCGVCASDFSSFTPEKVISEEDKENKKKEEDDDSYFIF